MKIQQELAMTLEQWNLTKERMPERMKNSIKVLGEVKTKTMLEKLFLKDKNTGKIVTAIRAERIEIPGQGSRTFIKVQSEIPNFIVTI